MKRKTIPKRIHNVTYNDLLRETRELVSETNKRLSRLEKGIDINKAKYNPKTKRFERSGTYEVISETGERIKMKPTKIVKYGSDSWASKKLNEKLSTVKGITTSKGKIKISGNISIADLKAINKATTNFLRSKTSTVKGIQETESNIKSNIANLVEDAVPDLTTGEVNTLYDFFKDKDFNYITQYIDPSELFIILSETSSEDGTSDDFLRKIENYIYSDSLYQDDDLVEALESIYNKFVG